MGYEMSVCEYVLYTPPPMSVTEAFFERLTAQRDSMMQAFGEALRDAIREREHYMHIMGDTEEDEAQYAYYFSERASGGGFVAIAGGLLRWVSTLPHREE